MKLRDRVAIVTGGSAGIGRATAELLAREGAKVCLAARRVERGEAVAQAIREAGGEAFFVPTDVSDPAQVENMVRQTVQRWGRLDILFANAGINGMLAPLEDLTPEEWDQTLNVNLKGTFLSVKYSIAPLRASGGGSIIITSSINGTRVFSNPGYTAYSCSKAGQVAFTKMAALELARYKIRVNVICPGGVTTSIGENTARRNLERIRIPVHFPEGAQPLAHRPARPEQVAKLVLFLASEEADHITGAVIFIDGAESLLQG
ncbi:MAG TPA: SDR family oxidoreductase [Armatimonadetes bacterium]|nr:SDR family oxidoreductase [Armatimonadota bacterium]